MDFEEIGRNAKDLFKNKKFVVLCVIVGMVALILWIIRRNRVTTSTTETFDYYDGSQAIGYGGYGYPYAGSEEYSDYDWFYEKMDSLTSSTDEKWESILSANDEKWENIIDQMNSKYDSMLDKYDQVLEKLDNQDSDFEDISGSYGGYYGGGGDVSSSIDEQAIIDQMFANSYMWWDETTQTGRDALHDENLYLGGIIGADYDSESGVWSKDGVPLYTINRGNPIEEAVVATTGSRAPSSGAVDYTANVDYQAAINEGLRTGASAAVINRLNEQRNAKIAAGIGEYAATNKNFDPNTDYQALINQAKKVGADQSVIDNLTAQREAKIAAQKKGGAGVENNTTAQKK